MIPPAVPGAEQPAGPGPSQGSSGSVARALLLSGWGPAIRRSLGAFAVMAVLGQLAGFVVWGTGGVNSPAASFKVGWVYYALFHRIGISVGVEGLSIPGLTDGESFGLSYRLAGSAMLATAFAGMLLFWAGRTAATFVGGGSLARAVHGLKVAPAYALASLLGMLFLRYDFEGVMEPLASGDARVRGSLAGAVLLPLALALLMGALGGWMSVPRERWGRWDGLGRRALAGGWRMLVLGLGLSLAGLVIAGNAQPHEPVANLTPTTASYYRGVFSAGAVDGMVFMGHHVAVLPNEAVWVLVPAMGGCDGIYGWIVSFDLLCYDTFPDEAAFQGLVASAAGGAEIPSFPAGRVPAGYFLFLLVPLVSVVLGGRKGAAGAATRTEGLVLGIASGIVFGVLVGIAAWLAGLGIGVGLGSGGPDMSFVMRFGPQIASALGLGLAWGTLGGALGGVLARLAPAPPAGAPSASVSGPPPLPPVPEAP